MQFLSGILSLMLGVMRQLILAERSHFCEAMASQQCSDNSQGLLEALKSGNQRQLIKECDALQATIDCLSVPRCHGNLLKMFRYFVLTTATTLKQTRNMCANLDVTNLEGYVKGLSVTCKHNKHTKDECDRRCKCKDGYQVSCYRVRKEFTMMSLAERRRFIDVLKLVSTDPRYRSKYERLATLHSRIPSEFLHHMPQIFLPWHRWYLLEFENLLREIDCRVTIPYWNWSKDAVHWTRGSELEDVWNPGPHGLGGNGVLPHKCVMDGPFKESQFTLGRSAGGGCLKRKFNFSCNLPNQEDALNLIKVDDFLAFEHTVRETFHPTFHDCVGGHMFHHTTASFTPEFWIHHGFIDKLWTDWQGKDTADKFQYYTNVSYTMPGSERFPWEYLDVHDLPGGVKVLYENCKTGVDEKPLWPG